MKNKAQTFKPVCFSLTPQDEWAIRVLRARLGRIDGKPSTNVGAIRRALKIALAQTKGS